MTEKIKNLLKMFLFGGGENPRCNGETQPLEILDQGGVGKFEPISLDGIRFFLPAEGVVDMILVGAKFCEGDRLEGERLSSSLARQILSSKRLQEILEYFVQKSLQHKDIMPEELQVCREFAGGIPGEDNFMKSQEFFRLLAGAEDAVTAGHDGSRQSEIESAIEEVEMALFQKWSEPGQEEQADFFISRVRKHYFGDLKIIPGRRSYEKYLRQLNLCATEIDLGLAEKYKSREEIQNTFKEGGIRNRLLGFLGGLV